MLPANDLRPACEDAGKGYLLAVPVNFQVTTPGGRKTTAAALARLVRARCWETRSCGVAGATATMNGRWWRPARPGTGCTPPAK